MHRIYGTGYIGGSVLARFLARPDFQDLKITALVRSAEKAGKLNALGVETVVGALQDLDSLEKAASEADVVINTADSDDLDAVRAILRGLEKQHATTGKVPLLIHTVSSEVLNYDFVVLSVLTDNAGGMYAYDTIYDDADPDQIETLPLTQIHRVVDLTIIEADKKGYAKTYIIFPSLTYGLATGKLVDLEVQNKYSIQLPYLIAIGLDRGEGGMVGAGKSIWPNRTAHLTSNVVTSVADLYLVLYDAIFTAGSNVGHGREGIYFGENGEHSWYDLSAEISKVLVKIGRSTSDKPTTFTKDEMQRYFGGYDYFGTNSRCRANRSRAIGWKPKYTTESMYEGIAPEVDALLENNEYLRLLKQMAAFFPSALK
ncbi:hypothetical protein H0H92_015557 [Tricholoma furcatifolium]|nr:hypothetical protein H0H92_015557 [Tricholoma furcatifolium]